MGKEEIEREEVNGKEGNNAEILDLASSFCSSSSITLPSFVTSFRLTESPKGMRGERNGWRGKVMIAFIHGLFTIDRHWLSPSSHSIFTYSFLFYLSRPTNNPK